MVLVRRSPGATGKGQNRATKDAGREQPPARSPAQHLEAAQTAVVALTGGAPGSSSCTGRPDPALLTGPGTPVWWTF